MKQYDFSSWDFNRILYEKETILNEIRLFIFFNYGNFPKLLDEAERLKENLFHFRMSLSANRGTEPYGNIWDNEFKIYENKLNTYLNM